MISSLRYSRNCLWIVACFLTIWAILSSGGSPDPRLRIRDARMRGSENEYPRPLTARIPNGFSKIPPTATAQASSLFMNQQIATEFSNAFGDLLVNNPKAGVANAMPPSNSSARDFARLPGSAPYNVGPNSAGREKHQNEAYGQSPKHQEAWSPRAGTPLTYEQLLTEAARRSKMKIWSEAEALCRQAMALKPGNPLASMLLAATCLQRGNIDGSAKVLEQLTAEFPGNAVIIEALGRVRLQQGRVDDAFSGFQRAGQLKPDWDIPYQDMGLIHYRRNELAKAEEAFRQSSKLSEDSVPPLLGLALVIDRQGRVDEARSLYESVLDRQPNLSLALNNLAYIYAQQGSNLDKAVQMAGRAANLSPLQHSVWDTFGWSQFKSGKKEAAIQSLQRAVSLAPGLGMPYFHLAKALESNGSPDKAKEAFKKAVENGLPPTEKQEAQTALSQSIH